MNLLRYLKLAVAYGTAKTPRQKLLNRKDAEAQRTICEKQNALGVSDLLLLRHYGMRWNDELIIGLSVMPTVQPTKYVVDQRLQ